MGSSTSAGLSEIAAAAEAATVFAYPLLLAARSTTPETANRLEVGRQRPDTRTFCARLDLDVEPVVIVAPDTRGRYYVLWLRDAWNELFASVGARTTGTGPRAFAVLGPGRHGAPLPRGLTPIPAPSRFVGVSGCIEALTGSDDPAAGFRIATLSRLHDASGAAGARVPTPPAPCRDARRLLTDGRDLLAGNPPTAQDAGAAERLRAVAALADAELDVDQQAALERGARRGQDAVHAAVCPAAPSDHLRRARAAWSGAATEPAADAFALRLDRDDAGRPLHGRERYELRFPPGDAPPVHGLWSLMTEPSSGGCVSDLSGLALQGDGSLAVPVQRDPPARACRANWLRAPDAGFALVLRLYWPREEVLQGRWRAPVLTRTSPRAGAAPCRRAGGRRPS